MNIHEYQAKQLLKKYGAPVANGVIVMNADEAEEKAASMDAGLYVVKAQIHAGGRGKGKFKEPEAGEKGGVRLAKTAAEAAEEARKMLGSTLVTKQTGEAGKVVNRVYIEDGADIETELYLSVLVDRASSRVAFIASTEGGMDIEEVAEETPEKILTLSIDPDAGVTDADKDKLVKALGLSGDAVQQGRDLMGILYQAFTEKDMDMLEINPLIVMTDGNVRVLDAKVSFDSNAEFRQPDLEELRDPTEEDPLEARASEFDLSYVNLDGNIGCMVNGAGLAMSTMDIIKHYGAEPANFLDVGGGASKENITEAFKIITSDDGVQGILINIFGGIMKCDVIAEGTLAAVKEVGLSVPLVVRLEGTNVELGKKIINESDLDVIAADDLDDAARKIVAAVQG
ncbi:MAG: ADP-forming succinate--CoA ligase subunit beta [Aquisalinus sp.]|nr:ADP-forming succinate--CoA ligase subunit beta [Aquisalinus sp.]